MLVFAFSLNWISFLRVHKLVSFATPAHYRKKAMQANIHNSLATFGSLWWASNVHS